MASCISPLSIKRGEVRTVVPCGKCNFCLQRKRSEWAFRLRQELKVCTSAYFLTLTYRDECLPLSPCGIPELRKDHMQLFMKRLRKENARHCGSRLRYYSVGEYGTRTDRPHYHSIMFNLCQEAVIKLDSIWSLGGTYVGPVGPGAIPYVTKYHLNKHTGWDAVVERRSRPFVLSAIGPVVSARVIWLAVLSGIKSIVICTLLATVLSLRCPGTIRTKYFLLKV